MVESRLFARTQHYLLMDNNLYFKDTKHRDSKMLLTRCALMTTLLSAVASIPSDPHFFTQLVDHFSVNPATYQQRYYLNDTAFAGTGSPILVIMGGEGAISPSTGIFYPSVVLLAQRFKALIIEPEHRGYGTSQPTPPFDTQRLSLITPQQALADAAALIFSMQQQYNCTGGVGSGPRCPVITIGGSYPGFLSAMMRLRYAGLVDAAYSASSPILLYSQLVDQYQYYKIVTDSAARASAGCPAAVRTMLTASLVGATKDAILAGANLCTPLPPYLESGTVDTLIDEINMVVMYSFANLNMANYPPPNTRLLAACQSIEKAASPVMALSLFLSGYGALRRGGSAPSGGGVAPIKSPSACYNLSLQLPSGPNATISSGDWSGVGSGDDGSAWDWYVAEGVAHYFTAPLRVNAIAVVLRVNVMRCIWCTICELHASV